VKGKRGLLNVPCSPEEKKKKKPSPPLSKRRTLKSSKPPATSRVIRQKKKKTSWAKLKENPPRPKGASLGLGEREKKLCPSFRRVPARRSRRGLSRGKEGTLPKK